MRTASILLAIALVMPACGKGEEAPAPTPSPAAVAPAGQAKAAPAAKTAPLSGTVAERVDASQYSYLKLTTADGEVWAAVPQTKVDNGTKVTVIDPMLMTNFESKALGKTFEKVYFGRLEGQTEPMAAQANPMAGGAGGHAAKAPAPAPKRAALEGTVAERLDAGQYSYLKLTTADGEVWAAVPKTTVETGAKVAVANPMLMTNFESKSLGRTFEQVYFGTLGDAAAPAAAGAAMPAGDMMGAGATNDAMAAHGKPAAVVADVKVDKAPGGLAVGEVWAQRSELAGKSVTIRGKVVKYNANILGKNWLHIQDGSGDAGASTHDLAVTTKDTATVGDVVTITGTLKLDQDFGAGYVYKTIVQDAVLAHE